MSFKLYSYKLVMCGCLVSVSDIFWTGLACMLLIFSLSLKNFFSTKNELNKYISNAFPNAQVNTFSMDFVCCTLQGKMQNIFMFYVRGSLGIVGIVVYFYQTEV